MSDSVTFFEAALSLTLVVVAVGLSMWRGIGVERSIVWAAFRAAVQLLAVGVILVWILDSSMAAVWAWLWVVFMVVVASRDGAAPSTQHSRTCVWLPLPRLEVPRASRC